MSTPLLLPAFIAFISRAYAVNDEDLREPARTRFLSEARRPIGWLARHFGSTSRQEVAVYFQWAASTFRRYIGQNVAGLRSRKGYA